MSGGTNPTPDNSSIETIVYRLDQITRTLESLTDRVDTKYVRFDLFDADKALQQAERLQITARLDKLESAKEWLIRAVGSLLLAAIVGAVLAGKSIVGGH